MPDDKISLFASLIDKYGIINVSFALVLFAFALTIPTMLTYFKDGPKRKREKDLVNVLTELSSEIKILARGYADSISMPVAENVMENVLKRHCWALFDFVRDIIEKNDIKNERKSIENRITMQISMTFTAIENDLVKYKYKTKALNEFIDRCEWEQQIYQVVIKTIYDEKLNGQKRITNSKSYLMNEFGNINFITLQTISKY